MERFDMKTRTAVLCCAGGAIAAALGYYGLCSLLPHPKEEASTLKNLLLLACLALWISGCIFFITCFVWCIVSEISRRRALHRPTLPSEDGMTEPRN
jgi:hypothetical protein